MPATQLAEVLEREYGAGWHRRFRHFSFAPIAAASIGRVHCAETHDGQLLALKIQYPRVNASIDSDMANLALQARTPGLVSAALDSSAMLARVREQLHVEADYVAEVRHATLYRRRLGSDEVLMVPAVHEEHCTAHIIATDFAPAEPVDCIAFAGAVGKTYTLKRHPMARSRRREAGGCPCT